MIHPLIDSLEKLNDNELNAKISELHNKYWKANNPGLQHQIGLLIEVYTNESSERRVRQWQKENADNRKKPLDDLIKIR